MGVGVVAQPIVHLYATCWNEEYFLPYFLEHYRAFVDKFVIMDDGSTDRSHTLLKREPRVEVRNNNRPATQPYINFNTDLYNNAWKESRGKADWVIITNVDEFMFARDISTHLAACAAKGVTVVPVVGFNMIRRDDPGSVVDLIAQVRRGAPSVDMNRFAIFNPDAMQEINYGPGRHTCRPAGDIVLPEKDRVLNLHFKRMGLARTFQRQRAEDARRSVSERRLGMGHQYGQGWEAFVEAWEALEKKAIDVFDWYARGQPIRPAPWWRVDAKRDVAAQV